MPSISTVKPHHYPSAMSVIGAGSYGTSLAISLARDGTRITLWGHRSKHMEILAQERENKKFLPNIKFPNSLVIESDLKATIKSAQDLLIVVPSHAFGMLLGSIKPHLRREQRICWATKGLEVSTGRLLQEVAVDILGNRHALAVLSGPTFAQELAEEMPTAISVASEDTRFVKDLQDKIHCSRYFRVYVNDDLIGLQIGGAVKNTIAIGAGISDGIGFGANARTALITRGLAEMSRLGVALGAQQETFMGMAGLGDLVLSCTDDQSRNRRFGLALGAGKTAAAAQREVGQVIEGYQNTKEIFLLSQRASIEMPIVEQIYEMLYQGKEARSAARDLLARDKKSE